MPLYFPGTTNCRSALSHIGVRVIPSTKLLSPDAKLWAVAQRSLAVSKPHLPTGDHGFGAAITAGGTATDAISEARPIRPKPRCPLMAGRLARAMRVSSGQLPDANTLLGRDVEFRSRLDVECRVPGVEVPQRPDHAIAARAVRIGGDLGLD